MQLSAKFKKILYMGFRATLNQKAEFDVSDDFFRGMVFLSVADTIGADRMQTLTLSGIMLLCYSARHLTLAVALST